jgi:hypothetical protein
VEPLGEPTQGGQLLKQMKDAGETIVGQRTTKSKPKSSSRWYSNFGSIGVA